MRQVKLCRGYETSVFHLIRVQAALKRTVKANNTVLNTLILVHL